MQKTLTLPLLTLVLTAGLFTLGNIEAQQTPAAKPKSAAPSTTKSTTATKPKTAATAKPAVPLTTTKDKFSYTLGMNLGNTLRSQSVDVDPAILLRGLKDALAGTKPALTEEQAHAAMLEVQTQVRKQMEEKLKTEADKNKKEGDVFLAANKTKSGVITLPDGLQYKVLTAGTGPKPSSGDTVVCNYRGTLLNGNEFDSSYKRGQPVTFPVKGLIKGWTEALPLMPVGSKWQLYVPAELAYGEHSPAPDVIPPNSTLIFDLELISIKPPDTTSQKAPDAPAQKAPDKAPDAGGDKKP